MPTYILLSSLTPTLPAIPVAQLKAKLKGPKQIGKR